MADETRRPDRDDLRPLGDTDRAEEGKMGNAAFSAKGPDSRRETIPISSAVRGVKRRRIPRAAMIAALDRNAEFVIDTDDDGNPRVYEVPALPGPDSQGGSIGS